MSRDTRFAPRYYSQEATLSDTDSHDDRADRASPPPPAPEHDDTSSNGTRNSARNLMQVLSSAQRLRATLEHTDTMAAKTRGAKQTMRDHDIRASRIEEATKGSPQSQRLSPSPQPAPRKAIKHSKEHSDDSPQSTAQSWRASASATRPSRRDPSPPNRRAPSPGSSPSPAYRPSVGKRGSVARDHGPYPHDSSESPSPPPPRRSRPSTDRRPAPSQKRAPAQESDSEGLSPHDRPVARGTYCNPEPAVTAAVSASQRRSHSRIADNESPPPPSRSTKGLRDSAPPRRFGDSSPSDADAAPARSVQNRRGQANAAPHPARAASPPADEPSSTSPSSGPSPQMERAVLKRQTQQCDSPFGQSSGSSSSSGEQFPQEQSRSTSRAVWSPPLPSGPQFSQQPAQLGKRRGVPFQPMYDRYDDLDSDNDSPQRSQRPVAKQLQGERPSNQNRQSTPAPVTPSSRTYATLPQRGPQRDVAKINQRRRVADDLDSSGDD